MALKKITKRILASSKTRHFAASIQPTLEGSSPWGRKGVTVKSARLDHAKRLRSLRKKYGRAAAYMVSRVANKKTGTPGSY